MAHEWLHGYQPTGSQLTEWVVDKLLHQAVGIKKAADISDIYVVILAEAVQTRDNENPKSVQARGHQIAAGCTGHTRTHTHTHIYKYIYIYIYIFVFVSKWNKIIPFK